MTGSGRRGMSCCTHSISTTSSSSCWPHLACLFVKITIFGTEQGEQRPEWGDLEWNGEIAGRKRIVRTTLVFWSKSQMPMNCLSLFSKSEVCQFVFACDIGSTIQSFSALTARYSNNRSLLCVHSKASDHYRIHADLSTATCDPIGLWRFEQSPAHLIVTRPWSAWQVVLKNPNSFSSQWLWNCKYLWVDWSVTTKRCS